MEESRTTIIVLQVVKKRLCTIHDLTLPVIDPRGH